MSEMTREQAIELLKSGAEGVREWNERRDEKARRRGERDLPDLADADFQGAELEGVDLVFADLEHANLRYANLQGAILGWTNLRETILSHACTIEQL